MNIKSNKERFKEKINQNTTRSKIKIVNVGRLKSIRTLKDSSTLRYSSKILKPYIKDKKATKNINKVMKSNIKRRTQTLTGNVLSNAKAVIRESGDNEKASTGIQAGIYFSDKIDTATDVFIGSKRIIRAVKNVRKNVNDSKSINELKPDNNAVVNGQAKGKVNRTYLFKQLSKKGAVNVAKSSFMISRNVKNQLSQSLSSDDTSLGIKSFAYAEKEIRKTIDTVKTVKDTSREVVKIAKTANKLNTKSNNYIRDKIYSEKNKRYSHIKESIQKTKSNKIRTNQKLKTNKMNKANSSNIIRAKSQIKRKLTGERAVATAKRAFRGIKNSLRAVIMLKNPIALVAIGLIAILIMINSGSAGMIAMLAQNYFVADDEVAMKYKEKVEKKDNDLKAKISSLENDGSCDSSKVIYIGDNQDINTNFQEIFALAAVKFEQDLTFSYKEEEFIEKIHSKLYDIRVSTERYTKIVDGEKEKMKRKIITVYAFDMETVMNKLKYDDEQKSWSRRLVSNFSEQFTEFAQQYGELSQEEINDLINNAQKLSNVKQKKLYETALSIVGKVKYFWGGKSSKGWNDEWGEPTLVTSPGNDTTGKYIPYGLDCSGYVDWVYKTSGIGNMLSGGGTAYQWGQSYPVNRDDLQVGDLAFMQMPNSSGINHVGIYVGKDKDGNNLYAHSEWGTGATVNGFKGFKYFRRVVRFE